MNTSASRTDSSKRQYTSPAANVFSVTGLSPMPRSAAMASASAGFARPEKRRTSPSARVRPDLDRSMSGGIGLPRPSPPVLTHP